MQSKDERNSGFCEVDSAKCLTDHAAICQVSWLTFYNLPLSSREPSDMSGRLGRF